MDITTLVYYLVTFGTILFLYIKYKLSYWRKRNVFHKPPEFFLEYSKTRPHRAEQIMKLYNEARDNGKKYVGCYFFLTPQFIPADADLVKSILQRDFAYFANHGVNINVDKDPLTGHLFNLENEKWRFMRAKLTPTFTSGKMKMMFETMMECTEGFQELLKKASENNPVNMKNLLACFTTDVVGSVAFGLDINSMKNPDSEFREYGSRILRGTLRKKITVTIFNVFPRWLTRHLNIKFFDDEMNNFFINLVRNIVTYREANNIYRRDFMHLLIQLKNMGKITEDDDESLMFKNEKNAQGMTINEITAQVLIFFLAGFETSATTMTFTLLELAQNQDVQDKLRNEINTAIEKNGGKVTYDLLAEMEYLDMVIQEALRKHPPVSTFPRVCTKAYHVPNSDYVMDAGTRVYIPVLSIHRDSRYWPDPEKFDPERFSPENKRNIHPYAYLPFGDGPRKCIGLRFGLMQTRVGLTALLRNFRVTLSEKTKVPITYQPGFIINVRGGTWLNVEPVT